MKYLLDKKGNRIEAVLSKKEQLALMKENNRRAKAFLQEMTKLSQETGQYENTGDRNSNLVVLGKRD
jgi:hypothetical protein